jgi:putative thioredoxin
MSSGPYSFDATEQNYTDTVLKRSQAVPVLVDFWAAWCAPCQALMPMLQRLSDEYQGKFLLAKVNSDEQQALAHQYGIRSLPTVLLIRHGEVVDRFIGAQQEAVIRQLVDRHIARESDPLRTAARACLDQGDVVRARELLESARRSDPDNHHVTLDLADLAVRSDDDPAAALELLAALPPEQQQSAPARALSARARLAQELQGTPDIAALELQVGAQAGDLAARYQLALRRILAGMPERGMEDLLEIVRRDRRFRDDGARMALLAAFELLDGQPELVNRFRRSLSSALH